MLLREKLKYMVFRGLFTLAGFILGNLSNDTEAQSGSETLDKLTVREMVCRMFIILICVTIFAHNSYSHGGRLAADG